MNLKLEAGDIFQLFESNLQGLRDKLIKLTFLIKRHQFHAGRHISDKAKSCVRILLSHS